MPNDDGTRAYIQAHDIATDKLLWEVTLFRKTINPLLEEDVQHVYVNSLTLKDGTLLATAEDGRQFVINLKTHKVTKLPKSKNDQKD